MKKYSHVIGVSFVILFLELLLIRLIGTEIRIFAYFSNLLLLGIFVGSGLGMLLKKHIPISVGSLLLLGVTTIVIFGWLQNITEMIAPLSESFFWFQSAQGGAGGVIGGLFLTLLLFLLTTGVFVPLGQILGNLFESTEKLILVYSINVAASLAGMWLFQAISLYNISLFIGILFVQFLLIFLAENWTQKKIILVCFFVSLIFISVYYDRTKNPTVWSPYQKLTLITLPKAELQPEGYLLQVNNVGYMGLLNLSDSYKKEVQEKLKNIKLPAGIDLRFSDQYALPFIFKPESQSALIVGAGGGNDVAAALRAGLESIDAVEIDPQIIKFGKLYHPEKPYDSKAVTVYNDDGRSFFKRTSKKYDLVIMGLADSHTLTSSLANVRLDHYLYTQESFQEIKRILKPDGLLFLTFDVRKDWIGGRIQKNLTDVFGAKPLVFNMQDSNYFGWGGIVFVVGPDKGAVQNLLNQNPDFKNFIQPRILNYNETINPLTDDWPYLYLDKHRLPQIHLWISLFLIVFMFLFKGLVSGQERLAWDFFFLGAGFLLYEFQNISKTSLLFGNTWVTNLFTITFILLFILLANLIQAKKPLPLKITYVCLILSLIAQFFMPLSALNSLSITNRVILGSLFLNLPFLFSGMIFITKLNLAPSKSAAFASNLLGSAVGGILEIFSFLFGIQSLLIFSLALYVLSMFPWTLLRSKNLPSLMKAVNR